MNNENWKKTFLFQCSLRSCSMFQEPFFLHPPGTRPRDGIYINPMSAFIEPQKSRDSESFYLHSPNDLVYTRITQIFGDNQKSRIGERNVIPRKDETLTGKWHVPDITYSVNAAYLLLIPLLFLRLKTTSIQSIDIITLFMIDQESRISNRISHCYPTFYHYVQIFLRET